MSISVSDPPAIVLAVSVTPAIIECLSFMSWLGEPSISIFYQFVCLSL